MRVLDGSKLHKKLIKLGVIKNDTKKKMFIVKSTKNGVDKPIEIEIDGVIESVGLLGKEKIPIDRYNFSVEPYYIDIVRGENKGTFDGYGSGIGDLWAWTYFGTFSKKVANDYYQAERIRVESKYGKI